MERPLKGLPRRALVGAALIPALAVGLNLGAGLAFAQEAAPEVSGSADRAAEIRAGDCDEGDLGEVVAPLTELAVPEGEGVGQVERAVPAAASFTSVPLPIEVILAEDHALVVFGSTDEDAPAIACGELGGITRADGSLVIGLGEVDGSGSSGIAFLGVGADGASTAVSVFVADGLGSEAPGGRSGERGAAATPIA